MPTYDYRCPRGHVVARLVSLADFDRTQSVACDVPVWKGRLCGRSSVRVMLRAPSIKGMARLGAQAWDGGGLWGHGAGDDRPMIREARTRAEGKGLSRRLRGRGLAFARLAEVALEQGLRAEAEAYEHGLSTVAAESDRVAAGRPKIVRHRGKPIVVTTHTRRRGRAADRVVTYRAA